MARCRNLKPGFFKNEDLAECSAWARLCFAGLWTLADREGRLEDRPKRIKGELFAFDSCDVEPLLAQLEAHEFILRYKAAGLGIIQILAFANHQNPHHREPQSHLPSPESLGLLSSHVNPKPGAHGACEADTASDTPEALPAKGDLPTTPSRADTGTLIPDKDSEANASGADAPPDAKDVVYALGVPFITAAGVSEKNARSFLAMQCKLHTDRAVADALEAAVAAKAIQPIPWLQDRLGGKSKRAVSFRDHDLAAKRELVRKQTGGLLNGRPDDENTIDMEARDAPRIAHG